MPADSIVQPPTASQNRSAPSTSCAGNSTCTTFLPISNPPFGGPVKLYAHASTTRRESDGSCDRAVRRGAGRGAVRASRGAVPAGPGGNVPARARVRRADGRARVPVLRRVGVARHGLLQGGVAQRGVH